MPGPFKRSALNVVLVFVIVLIAFLIVIDLTLKAKPH